MLYSSVPNCTAAAILAISPVEAPKAEARAHFLTNFNQMLSASWKKLRAV